MLVGKYAQYGGAGERKPHGFEYHGTTLLIDLGDEDEARLRGLLRFAGEALGCDRHEDLDGVFARWRHWLRLMKVERVPEFIARRR